MADFSFTDGATRTDWFHSKHEDKMYVRKYAANEDAIARLASIVRANGGTRTLDGGRLAASIPGTVFDMMEEGKIFGGKYAGIKSADKETRERLMAAFLASDGRMYVLNDTKRGHY